MSRPLFVTTRQFLSNIGAIATDVAFVVANAHAMRLKERVLRLNEQLTGNRLLRGMASLGGVRLDWGTGQLETLSSFVSELRPEFDALVDMIRESSTTRDRLEASEAPTLSGSPLLPRLRALCLSSTNLEGTHAGYFASAGYVSRLRFLALSSTGLGSAGLAALLDGLEGNRLRSLKLTDNPLQDGGLERLAAAAGLGRLRELDPSWRDRVHSEAAA